MTTELVGDIRVMSLDSLMIELGKLNFSDPVTHANRLVAMAYRGAALRDTIDEDAREAFVEALNTASDRLASNRAVDNDFRRERMDLLSQAIAVIRGGDDPDEVVAVTEVAAAGASRKRPELRVVA